MTALLSQTDWDNIKALLGGAAFVGLLVLVLVGFYKKMP